MKKNRTAFAILAVVAMLAMLIAVPFASADAPTDTTALRNAVTFEGIEEHLVALEALGPRPSGMPGGYDASVDYVVQQLRAAGYDPAVKYFGFLAWWPEGPSTLEQTAPGMVTYVEDVDYHLMSDTDPGDVSGFVTPVDLDLGLGNSSTSGCEASDFDGFPAGNIALIQRGACTFQLKAENAAAAGAVGAIIFNQGNTDARKGLLIGATLSADYVGGIPVFFATYDRGVEWADTEGLVMHMIADVFRGEATTANVLAETPGGRDDRVVVVGAHLDTEPVGPGINDNGSGVATILEIAQQMATLGIEPRNKVVFAFWGAEESGLLGAQHYVDSLTKRERKNIALNLNFDMLASNNYALFVYDGDGSDTPWAGPTGSANTEDVFLDYFASQDLATWPTAFDGRSDYGPFIEVGIPAGGLFSGGDDLKTEEQAAIYGGTAGIPYDPYYHTPDDTLANINEQALDYMSDGVAHAVLTFAMTKSAVPGTAKGSTQAMEAMEYKGPKAQK